MTDEAAEDEKPSKPTPVWERDQPTLREAIMALEQEAMDIEGFQERLAEQRHHYPGATIPSPTAMRKAVVMRYASTIINLVDMHSDEFKEVIKGKRGGGRRSGG